MKKYLAELVGTFLLVFFGTGAIVVDVETGGAIGNAGIAVTFGLAVMILIFFFGKISGAHINPAVTLALFVAKLFPSRDVLPYLLSQFLGAVLASTFLHQLFPNNVNLGATQPSGSSLESLFLEIILAFFLILTILLLSNASTKTKKVSAIIIGGLVWLEALLAGPICGASMNPFRSLGPALVSGNLQHLWIYLAAPVLGSLLAVTAWSLFRNREK